MFWLVKSHQQPLCKSISDQCLLSLSTDHDSSPRKPVGGENGEPQAPSNGFPNPVFTVEDGAAGGVDEPMKESDAASEIVTTL